MLTRVQLERHIRARIAVRNLQKNQELWNELTEYKRLSGSTGTGWLDYWTLYSWIRTYRPKEVLECGTGVSTVVIAHALLENRRLHGVDGRVTSLEDMPQYFQQAVDLLPPSCRGVVDLLLRERTEYFWGPFRGTGYRSVPERAYDFVFVDGPGTTAPSDGHRAFNFDLINVARRAEKPVVGIVDKRKATCWVYQHVFGPDKVFFDEVLGVGVVGPISATDLRDEISSSLSFGQSSWLRKNRDMRMTMVRKNVIG